MTAAMNIRLHILEESTNGFSANSIIGRGGYGDVYKGVLPNGEVIAVKLLHDDPVHVLDDAKFNNEVVNLLRVEHPNIVRLLGYCYETQQEYVEHNGETRLCKRIYRVLCFEYLQDGSLDRHLLAGSFAPNWSTRYNIIKGICEGLNFLHRCKPPIFHLDLKPANILLDSSMVPKVADFGLSRLFNRSHTQVTEKITGTQNYMPPEFIREGIISNKNDVFSLGIVIREIIVGHTSPSLSSEMADLTQFMQEVHTNWKNILEATSEYPSEELHQVQICMDIAVSCVEPERNNRPTIADIVVTLNKTETRIPKKQMTDMVPFPTIGPNNIVTTTSRKMVAEINNITNKYWHHNFMPRDSFNVQLLPDIRETSSSIEEALIIGRTEEKQKILSIFSKSITKEMVILPIFGIGGIGKTTLAQLVFHDTQFHDYSRVWVYVSQKFALKQIGNSIISQLTNQINHIAETQMLHNRLRELFAGKNILIVLDDLWEEKQHELDKLKAILRPCQGSMVIIVTTRDEAIARKISMTVMPYKLELLTDDVCWTIIKQKSSFQDRHDKEQLEQIGRDIAIKCGGVALAAQSLGYMLREMTSDQWESVRDSSIWNLSNSEGPSSSNQVLTSLLISYSHMHEFLQLCFSYCAVFPKGRNIVKYDLIHQWIALGLTEHSSAFDSMQLCEIYITHLLGMSFLEYSKTRTSSDGLRDKAVTLFTMHDLVHDLARATLADKVNEKGTDVGSSCNYALLTDCSKPLQLSVSSTENTGFKYIFNPFKKLVAPKNIKALCFVDCGNIWLRGRAFLPAKCLLVLDLSECLIKKLPHSIGQLKQLRFLCAPRIQDQAIPVCITKLSELNYLSLRGSRNISALPKSIGDMKRLMHLDLSECHGISELPVSFGELKQLVHLDLAGCNVSISEAFGGFTKLQYLNLSIGVATGVKRRGLSKVISNLIKLRYLNLSGCMEIMETEDEISSVLGPISTLSNLEYLGLSRNPRLSSLPESIGNLRKLHTLDLSHCYDLKKLPDSMVNMVSLKVLNVERSVTLDESVLSLLNIVSLPHFVVHASSHKCSSNILRLQPTNPIELSIDRLENVKYAEEAQCIKLIEKQKVERLKFQWTIGAWRIVDDKEVLEKLVPPRSVQRFYIEGYSSASFPDWFMGIKHYLPNLLEIYLCNFSNCNNLPPLGQLPNLEKLSLSHMDGLEEWKTEYTSGKKGANKLLFPKLKKLTMHHCAKLRIKPCLPRAKSLHIVDCDNVLSSEGENSSHSRGSFSCQITNLFVENSKVPLHQWKLLHNLPALRSLTISHCSDLTASRAIIKHLSSLQLLDLRLEHDGEAARRDYISYFFMKAELPSWLFELPSLRKLIISHRELQILDGNISKLTQLQELSLSECTNMASLPQWLGELASLNKLEIKDCEVLSSLPDSIQQLNKLERLTIYGCPTLVEWFKSKENRMKLAHIREKVCDGTIF